MSFIRKRGKIYHLYWRDENSQQVSRSLKTGNRELAREIQKRFDDGRIRERFGLSEPIPIGDLIHRRLNSLSRTGTLNRETSVYKAFQEFLGDSSSVAITPVVIEKYKTWRLNNGISHNGLNTELRHLHRLFTWGEEQGLCRAMKIKKVKPEKHKPMAITLREVQRLYDYIAMAPIVFGRRERIRDIDFWRLYWRVLLRLYLLTGGRKCEVALLRWKNIDEDVAAVIFTSTKTDEDRAMPLKLDLLDELKTLRALTEAGPEDLIALHKPDQIFSRIKDFMLAAGIPASKKPGLHVLRRTFGSYHYQLNKDLLATKGALGHADSKTTEHHYIDTLEDLREQVEKLPF